MGDWPVFESYVYSICVQKSQSPHEDVVNKESIMQSDQQYITESIPLQQAIGSIPTPFSMVVRRSLIYIFLLSIFGHIYFQVVTTTLQFAGFLYLYQTDSIVVALY